MQMRHMAFRVNNSPLTPLSKMALPGTERRGRLEQPPSVVHDNTNDINALRHCATA
jgi:hypothetical protein